MPTKESEWKEIAKCFEKWNFPNCVGAKDGKHGNYNFIYANVEGQDQIPDAGIFNDTWFSECLQNNTLSLPTSCILPGSITTTPFVFLGDDTFPLLPNTIKPFPELYMRKGSKERIFIDWVEDAEFLKRFLE